MRVRPLAAAGERVSVRTIEESDVAPYRRAVLGSAERLRVWNPVNPDDIRYHLGVQSDTHRTFLVLAHEREGDHDIVGKINLVNVVRGAFRSGVFGYDAYDPYAGRGLFREGLALVIGIAFSRDGMDLHRVEANVQPGNAVSAGMLRSLGFRREGFIPRMLYLPDARGQREWRDHDSYALTREEWPARPYPALEHRRTLVVVVSPDPVLRGVVADRLSAELAVPRVSEAWVGENALEQILQRAQTGLVADCSGPDVPDVLAGAYVVRPESVPTPGQISRWALAARGAAQR